MASYHDRADFWQIARSFGLNPFDQSDAGQTLHPSKPTADYLWRRIATECFRIEQGFVAIYHQLSLLRAWERTGFAQPDDVDDMADWVKIRAKALPLLLDRFGHSEESFEDGAGI